MFMIKSIALLLSCAFALTACEMPGTCQCPAPNSGNGSTNSNGSSGSSSTTPSAPAELVNMAVLTLENGSIGGDEIRLTFSTPIATTTPNSESTASAAYADNYIVQVNNGSEMTWGTELNGLAVIDSGDPERKRVILRLIKPQTDNVFRPGDEVKITVLPRITDAQGQPISPTLNRKTVNAT